MLFNEHFIKTTIPDAVIIGTTFPDDISFSIDSRTVQQGDIFLALEGATVDGHDYVRDALAKGAAGVMVCASKKDKAFAAYDVSALKDKLIIVVPDTLKAFIALASAWRAQFEYPVIAVTGSIGKTTTKEMIASIVNAHGMSYIASQGNQNTRIGVSLTIFKMRPTHQVAIFELGINRRGEMAHLVDILRPTTGVITAIGHSHMEGLGSLTDIALEKRDIFKYFNEKSIGIINGDQPVLANVGYNHPVVKFGSKTINQIQARKINCENNQASFILKIYKEKVPMVMQNTHVGRIFNALAATAVAHLLGIPTATIVKGILACNTVSGRFEQRQLAGVKGSLIDDCYNASPESMKAALTAFEQIDTPAQKVAVLGDMLELGVNSPFWHRQLGRFLRKVPSLRKVILVGDMVKWTKKTIPMGVQVEHVPSWQEAIKKIDPMVKEHESVILIKGSRGMRLDNVVEHFSPKKSQAIQA